MKPQCFFARSIYFSWECTNTRLTPPALFFSCFSSVFSSCLPLPPTLQSLNPTSCWVHKTHDWSQRCPVKQYLYNIINRRSNLCLASGKVAKWFKMSRIPWRSRWLTSQIFLSLSLWQVICHAHTSTPLFSCTLFSPSICYSRLLLSSLCNNPSIVSPASPHLVCGTCSLFCPGCVISVQTLLLQYIFFDPSDFFFSW